MDIHHFLNTSDDVALPSPLMTWQLPPVPEQSLDCFFNSSYDPIKGQFLREKLPILNKSMLINPNLPAVSSDPGFAERAARFSPFGSRSFNGRNNNEFQQQFKSNENFENLKLFRACSTPSLRSISSQTNKEIRPENGSCSKFGEISLDRSDLANANDGSSVSGHIPIVETEAKTLSSSRKRKTITRGKTHKMQDEQSDRDTKRCKSGENIGIEYNVGKKERKDENEDDQSDETNVKAPEAQKDYIHVRARRGQATDSHSLAERVRREKISERMKFLQDLVPGCNKVTGKALMLDEIINYVQSLQRQVEFLSMKLASVDPVDFNTDSFSSKNVSYSTYRVDSSFIQAKTDFLNRQISHCSLDPSDTTMCRDISLQLPFVDEIGQGFSQFLGSYEDDLQSIVQMGFGQNPGLHVQTFLDASDTHTTNHMSIEL